MFIAKGRQPQAIANAQRGVHTDVGDGFGLRPRHDAYERAPILKRTRPKHAF